MSLRPPQSRISKRQKDAGWTQPLLLLVRLLILGAGLGVLTGTALKFMAPRLGAGTPERPALLPQLLNTGRGQRQRLDPDARALSVHEDRPAIVA